MSGCGASVVLKVYGNLAMWLHRYHWLLLLLTAGSGGVFVYSLLSSVSTHEQTLVALCSLLWAMGLMVFVQAFVKPLPDLDEGGGFFVRLKVKFIRGVRWLMAVVVTVLFCVVLFVSSKAIGVLA